MSRTFIYRGHRRSKSARQLGRQLGCNVIRRTGSRLLGREDDIVINWGSPEPDPALNGVQWINSPAAVEGAINKLTCLATLSREGVPCIEHTDSGDVATAWWNEGHVVVGRALLRASEGRGIEIYRAAPGAEGLVAAPVRRGLPLYTKYFKGFDEYRVHVFAGQAVDVQQKRRRVDHGATNEIRNLENGWVFCREEVEAPAAVTEAAVRAVEQLGLDFGAVDIKFNRRGGDARVLECNTAPGLEGNTLAVYHRGIRSCY